MVKEETLAVRFKVSRVMLGNVMNYQYIMKDKFISNFDKLLDALKFKEWRDITITIETKARSY